MGCDSPLPGGVLMKKTMLLSVMLAMVMLFSTNSEGVGLSSFYDLSLRMDMGKARDLMRASEGSKPEVAAIYLDGIQGNSQAVGNIIVSVDYEHNESFIQAVFKKYGKPTSLEETYWQNPLVRNGKGLARTGLLKKTMFGYYMNL